MYLVSDKNGGKWIFKPADEEGFFQPQDLDEEEQRNQVVVFDGQMHKLALRRGVRYGDSVKKERAAFLLDHEGFAGVPETFMAHILQKNNKGETVARFGSLQQYKEHIASSEDMGSAMFSKEDVHRIGILDIRLLNLDRHLGNMLVTKKNGLHSLVPIDHGYILPSIQQTGDVNLEWQYWKQCKQPFSKETLTYIAGLDEFEDARILKSLDIRDVEILSCITSTMLLKRGAAKGLTLFDLCSILQRPSFDPASRSIFERLIEKTLKIVNARARLSLENLSELNEISLAIEFQQQTITETIMDGGSKGIARPDYSGAESKLEESSTEIMTTKDTTEAHGVLEMTPATVVKDMMEVMGWEVEEQVTPKASTQDDLPDLPSAVKRSQTVPCEDKELPGFQTTAKLFRSASMTALRSGSDRTVQYSTELLEDIWSFHSKHLPQSSSRDGSPLRQSLHTSASSPSLQAMVEQRRRIDSFDLGVSEQAAGGYDYSSAARKPDRSSAMKIFFKVIAEQIDLEIETVLKGRGAAVQSTTRP